MKEGISTIKNILMRKGVSILNPESVEISSDINPDRISAEGVIIHPGTRISGARTLILHGSIIGSEAPAFIDNCYIGPQVKLGGGYFNGSVFLKNVSIGSCAHVRQGCILEEGSRAGHSVGLKQTILFPYVTLGSLINFCDCFMAGGTGKKDHSEVGSSYVHFNFTPQQDKATPSLIGDVPNGVMLDQPPIFLGGQGGLVGPCRLGFGITIAAGTICRQDELRPHRLIFGGAGKGGNISYSPGIYRNVKQTFINNLIYIGNLLALNQWYGNARCRFISNDFPTALLEGLRFVLDAAIEERIKRLNEFIVNLQESSRHAPDVMNSSTESNALTQKNELMNQWGGIEKFIQSLRCSTGDKESMGRFLSALGKEMQKTGRDYTDVIKHLGPEARKTGAMWLQGIVDRLFNEVMAFVPSLGSLS